MLSLARIPILLVAVLQEALLRFPGVPHVHSRRYNFGMNRSQGILLSGNKKFEALDVDAHANDAIKKKRETDIGGCIGDVIR
jgi:hypothetical protein